MNERATVDEAFELLAEIVRRAPVVHGVQPALEVREGDTSADGMLEVLFSEGSTQRWVVKVKATPIEPQTAQLLALQLRDVLARGISTYAVVVAPFVSARAGEVLAQAGIGFADRSGNCRIATGSLYVERTGFENAFARKATARSLFTPGSERVLRALLDPGLQGHLWTLRELADRSFPGASLGQVHKVTRLLKEQLHMRREPNGLVVVEPGILLRSWAAVYRPERSRARHYYSPLSSAELRSRLVQANEQAKEAEGGVLASFSAAELWAPVVRQHRFFVYWIGDLRPLEGALELKPVDSGENVVVYAPYDEGVMYWSGMADETVTCAVQTYLDLRASPARGEEAAAAIFDRCLKPAYER